MYDNPEYKDVKDRLTSLTYQWMHKYNDGFYGAKDFKSVMPKESWQYNYTNSPVELFAEKNKQ